MRNTQATPKWTPQKQRSGKKKKGTEQGLTELKGQLRVHLT